MKTSMFKETDIALANQCVYLLILELIDYQEG